MPILLEHRSTAAGFVAAFAGIPAVYLIRNSLNHILGDFGALLAFVLPVFVASVLGGLLPGLLATGLSLLVGSFFFMEPRGSFAIDRPADVVSLITFGVVGVSLSLLCERLLRINQTLRASLSAQREIENKLSFSLEAAGLSVWEGHPPDENILPEDRELVREKLRAASEGQSDFQAEFRVKGPDDAPRWMLAHGRRPKDAPAPAQLQGILQDITDRKRAELALRESEERLRTILDSSPAVIYVKDLDGRYLFANKRLFELFHVTREQIHGKTDHDIFPADSADRFREHDRAALERGAITADETAPHDDGLHTYVSIKFPLLGLDAKPYATCGISTDITDRRKAEDAILRANADLKQFAWAASHDLQEPLRMVVSFAQLIERSYAARLDDAGRQFVEYVVEGARRLEILIHALRQFWELSQPPAAPFERVDLNVAFAQAVAAVNEPLTRHSVDLALPVLPAVIGEPATLAELFEKLLDNAIAYRDPSRPLRLQVASEIRGNVAQLCLSDNGVGIDSRYLETIFGIFKRLSPPGPVHAGMGLAICRKIVERHGGAIWAESELGAGSKFFVTLPLSR